METNFKVDSIKPDDKAWIDGASYEELLRKWRFTPAGGNTMFQGATGIYYSKRMAELRDSDPQEAVNASKRIGW